MTVIEMVIKTPWMTQINCRSSGPEKKNNEQKNKQSRVTGHMISHCTFLTEMSGMSSGKTLTHPILSAEGR